MHSCFGNITRRCCRHYLGWDGLRCAPAAPKLCVNPIEILIRNSIIRVGNLTRFCPKASCLSMILYYSSTIAPLSAKGYTAPPRNNGIRFVPPFKMSLIENWLLWLLPHTLYIVYMNIANPFRLNPLALAVKNSSAALCVY